MSVVQATLGSTLLDAALARENCKSKAVSTGCDSIDSILEGGFNYGAITSVAGASQAGKTLLALHAVAGHLLSDQSSIAFIDTTGSFSPLRLRDVLAKRLANAPISLADRPLSSFILELLDRVRIMRVFDFHGLTEAISELQGLLDAKSCNETSLDFKLGPVAEGEIANSEDEAEEDDGNAEMTETRPGIGMIVIDNVASIIGPELSKSQYQDQSFLVALLRSLFELTSQHNICTILINAAVGQGSDSASRDQRKVDRGVSAFAANLSRPALGKTYAHLIDLSVLLSSARSSKANGTTVNVFEIIEDRTGPREGRVSPFVIREGTSIEDFV